MRIQGRYFEVTDRFTPGQGRRSTPRPGRRDAPRPTSANGQSEEVRLVISEEPRLVISVPKRLVRLAVRRNAVKRVARESWRHAAAADRARLRPPAILLRLIRSPAGIVPAAEAAAAPAPTVATAATPVRKRRRVTEPVAPPLPLATFKRLLRADLDAIWAGRFRPSTRRGPGRTGALPAPPPS